MFIFLLIKWIFRWYLNRFNLMISIQCYYLDSKENVPKIKPQKMTFKQTDELHINISYLVILMFCCCCCRFWCCCYCSYANMWPRGERIKMKPDYRQTKHKKKLENNISKKSLKRFYSHPQTKCSDLAEKSLNRGMLNKLHF